MLIKCSECGHEIDHTTAVPRYNYQGLGVPAVLVNAVEETRCPNCNSVESTLIPNLNGLIASAAAERISIPIRLNGREIRFLREALDLTCAQLAQTLGVRNDLISRCEHDAETLGEHLERNFRALVYLRLRRRTIIKLNVERLLTMGFDDSPRLLEAVPLMLRLGPVPTRSKAPVRQRVWQPDPAPLKKTG